MASPDTNWFLVYVLSIADSVNGLCMTFGSIATVIAVACFAATDCTEDKRPAFLAAARKVGVIAALLLILGVLTPSTSDVIKAYAMVEGAKVVNAPNAEKAAAEFTKRVDTLIGKIGDK